MDPYEAFPELNNLPWLKHVFTLRQPGIEIGEDRAQTLAALRQSHDQILSTRGMSLRKMATGQQIHGNTVAWVDQKPQLPVSGADGIATATPDLPIGVYVADCCAIYLADPKKKAIAVLHSGLKGTQQNIAREGVETLSTHGSIPSDLIAVLSPCIRGCCYRTEFSDLIETQLREAGVSSIVRRDRCTACNNESYYSYNKEKGKTGRMLAAMMIAGN